MDNRSLYSVALARIVLGSVLLVHGIANTFGVWGGPALAHVSTEVAAQVSTTPDALASMAGYAQLGLGVLLLIGALARIAAFAALALVIAYAFYSGVYTAFFVRDKGVEYLLVIASMCWVVASLGPGPWKLDLRKLWPRRKASGGS